MSTKLFNSGGAALLPSAEGKRSYTTIAFGKDAATVKNFTMIEESQGSQASRIQVDATLDGGIHATGTTTGVGAYSAVFYDGPLCPKNDRQSAMAEYLKLKNLTARTATVYFYNDDIGGSSKPSAKFSGILNNMAVSLVEDNDLVYLRVALGMIGSWGV
jgi:hypothetical protein